MVRKTKLSLYTGEPVGQQAIRYPPYPAQDYATIEFKGIQEENPHDWQELTYSRRFNYSADVAFLYLVTRDRGLIIDFADKFAQAVEEHDLHAYEFGQDGYLGRVGCYNVTLFYVKPLTFEALPDGYFGDMFAPVGSR